MTHNVNLSGTYYSLAEFQQLHLRAIANPNAHPADLDAFAYVHTQALMEGREGFFVDEFDDDMAAALARHDGSAA